MDYQGSFAFGERHLVNVNAMLFNKDDPAMMGRIDPFFRQLVADAKAQGYGEYRTHLDYMDLVGRQLRLGRRGAEEAQRDGQGRARPERHPRAGQERDLAEGPGEAGMKKLAIAALLLAGGAAIAQGPPPAPKPTTLASRPDAPAARRSTSSIARAAMPRTAWAPACSAAGSAAAARGARQLAGGLRGGRRAARVSGNMPAIPRGEVSDDELKAIAGISRGRAARGGAVKATRRVCLPARWRCRRWPGCRACLGEGGDAVLLHDRRLAGRAPLRRGLRRRGAAGSQATASASRGRCSRSGPRSWSGEPAGRCLAHRGRGTPRPACLLADDRTVREMTDAAQPLDQGLVLGWVLAPRL
jgi:hypothetical protein